MTPCYGKSALFDSTAYADHDEARTLCLACPILAECRGRAPQKQSGHSGTWAGVLYLNGKPQRRERIPKTTIDHLEANALAWVADALGVTLYELIRRDQTTEALKRRRVAAWLLRNRFNYSLHAVGRMLNRDHTAVINAIRHLEADDELRTHAQRLAEGVAA